MISGQEGLDEGIAEDGNGEGNEVTDQLKKGPWTAEEDEILMEHVRKYGEGRWSAVQKYSGLARCGKSCRLRWANHLRPDLKKGSFTPEEERLILELQAKYGNKWARIAAELPGRTDNEIKNFWNSRIKRRLRDPNQNQGQQSYSSQPTTPTTPSRDFHFQFHSPQFPPRSPLSSTSSASLPFTINRPPPLLSSPARFKRHHRLSSITDQTPTGFPTSPNMSSNSFSFSSATSQSLSLLSSPTTQSSGLISPHGLHNSPMQSPLYTSLTHPASPRLSSMPNSPLTPHSPALLSTLSQPNSPGFTSLTRPNFRMHSSVSMPNITMARSQVLSPTGAPGSPILSLVGSDNPMLIPGENSLDSFNRNPASDLPGTSTFMFDGSPNDASYLRNSELPSNQISQTSSGITLGQDANFPNMASYDMHLEDPSQSDVIMDLKMKAGWTRGLKKRTRQDFAHGSKKNMAMARCAEELLKEEVDKANFESMKEPTKLEAKLYSGQSRAELDDSCGLLEDMLKESQAFEATMTSSGTETCLVFTEEKPLLGAQNDSINFSNLQSSAGDDRKEEQTLEQINSMHDDLSKLLDFDPSSLAVPELYLDCGDIANIQCSDGREDDCFNHHEMH